MHTTLKSLERVAEILKTNGDVTWKTLKENEKIAKLNNEFETRYKEFINRLSKERYK